MPVCNDCDRYFEGFDYGWGYNSQCGRCRNEEVEARERRSNRNLENEKLKLEVAKLKEELKEKSK